MASDNHSIRCGCGASLVTTSSSLILKFMSEHKGHDRLTRYPPYTPPTDIPPSRPWITRIGDSSGK